MSDEKMDMDKAVEEEKLAAEDAGMANDPAAALEERLNTLENDLAVAKQDVLYAHAETQNVRRRMEKELADARAYAATGFARDVLSVADNTKPLLVKVALSPVSIDKAKLNMQAEMAGWDFDATVKAADDAWNRELARIQIQTNDQTLAMPLQAAIPGAPQPIGSRPDGPLACLGLRLAKGEAHLLQAIQRRLARQSAVIEQQAALTDEQLLTRRDILAGEPRFIAEGVTALSTAVYRLQRR